ncbi:MAG: hypothetical protein FWE88_06235 [Phycisphaerae bacterium]|nr:hypothetical protein [Phycisphaerae bacterium]
MMHKPAPTAYSLQPTAFSRQRRPKPSRVAHHSSAFTLIEVVLTIALLTLLFSLAAFNYLGWGKSRKLEEGKSRLESLVRLCRAESCNLGKRIELAIDEEGAIVIRVEADPIGEPNVFVPLEAGWAKNPPNDLVRVVRSELLGTSSWRLIQRGGDEELGEDDQPMNPITFFPDATSDSAEIEFRQADREDGLHLLVTINGLTGELSSQIFMPLTEEEKARAQWEKDHPSASSYASGSSAPPPPPPCPD